MTRTRKVIRTLSGFLFYCKVLIREHCLWSLWWVMPPGQRPVSDKHLILSGLADRYPAIQEDNDHLTL